MSVMTNAGGVGGLDPDELTAEAGDILKGKLGGVKGNDEPVLGTLELTGDAADSHVMTGKTYYNTNAKQRRTGLMANNGAQDAALNCGQSKVIPAGYTTGGTVTANSLASQTPGELAASEMVLGQNGWVNGKRVYGSMDTMDGSTLTPQTYPQTISCAGKKINSNIILNGVGLPPGNVLAEGYRYWIGGNYVDGTLKDYSKNQIPFDHGTYSGLMTGGVRNYSLHGLGSSDYHGNQCLKLVSVIGNSRYGYMALNNSIDLTPYKTLRILVSAFYIRGTNWSEAGIENADAMVLFNGTNNRDPYNGNDIKREWIRNRVNDTDISNINEQAFIFFGIKPTESKYAQELTIYKIEFLV